QAVCAIRPGIRDDMQLGGHDLAIRRDASLIPEYLRVAAARAGEFLLARIFEAYRASGRDGQMRAQVFDQHFLLAAKTTVVARLNHPVLLHRQSTQRPDHTPNVTRHLGTGANVEPVILIPPRHHHMRLNADLLHLMYAVLTLKDMIGFGPLRLGVANACLDMVDDVALAVINPFDVGIIVDHRRSGLHRLYRIENRWKHLVVNLNEL